MHQSPIPKARISPNKILFFFRLLNFCRQNPLELKTLMYYKLRMFSNLLLKIQKFYLILLSASLVKCFISDLLGDEVTFVEQVLFMGNDKGMTLEPLEPLLPKNMN